MGQLTPTDRTDILTFTMNSKFLKLLTLTVGLLALSAAFVSAEEKKEEKCPCEKEKEKPAALIVAEEKKCDKCEKCCCDKEKPKAAGDEEKKEEKCPCEKEKPKA